MRGKQSGPDQNPSMQHSTLQQRAPWPEAAQGNRPETQKVENNLQLLLHFPPLKHSSELLKHSTLPFNTPKHSTTSNIQPPQTFILFSNTPQTLLKHSSNASQTPLKKSPSTFPPAPPLSGFPASCKLLVCLSQAHTLRRTVFLLLVRGKKPSENQQSPLHALPFHGFPDSCPDA